MSARWPSDAPALERLQQEVAALGVEPWAPVDPLAVGGVFFASATGSAPGERVWVAAVAVAGGQEAAQAVVRGLAPAPYVAGLLALRQGALLERAVRALDVACDVVLVDASGRDHPRRAGLALHLGWALGVPTVGVTDRPLLAEGEEPGGGRGDAAPLTLDGELVGYRLRTRRRARPLCVHAAWRTDAEVARKVVMASLARARTPEPIRRARHVARVERARDEGRLPPGWRDSPIVRRG